MALPSLQPGRGGGHANTEDLYLLTSTTKRLWEQETHQHSCGQPQHNAIPESGVWWYQIRRGINQTKKKNEPLCKYFSGHTLEVSTYPPEYGKKDNQDKWKKKTKHHSKNRFGHRRFSQGTIHWKELAGIRESCQIICITEQRGFLVLDMQSANILLK